MAVSLTIILVMTTIFVSKLEELAMLTYISYGSLHFKAFLLILQAFTYFIFVIFFTQAKFLENKICTEKTRKLRQNTQ